MKMETIWAMRAYTHARDVIDNPGAWCSASYALVKQDLPMGGFVVQGAACEVVEQIQVPDDSAEYRDAAHNSSRREVTDGKHD